MSWFKSKDKKKTDVIDVEAKEINEEKQVDSTINQKSEERKKEREEYRKEQRENTNESKSFKSDFQKALDEFEEEVQRFAKSVSDGFAKGFKTSKESYKSNKQSDITNRLVKILPYMNEQDIHEMVDKICSNDPDFEDLDPVAIMPFLGDSDCDKLFLFQMRKGGDINIEMVHFVSEDCLTVLVDAYIDGKYPSLDIDALYPFLNGDDVKKLFYYELKKNKEKK